MNNKAILIILDGWGVGDKSKSDAITQGETPYIDNLLKTFPNSTLLTSGEDVGLPNGQMGNSEVGHLNIGAGRVVYQDLVKINKAIKENTLAKNSQVIQAFEYAKNNNKQVHFIGLLSDGGVHSMQDHLYKLCEISDSYGLKKSYIHALTDGRDTDPKSGFGYISELLTFLENSQTKLATVSGRYYAMDRDKRWDRIKIAYDMFVDGTGEKSKDILKSVKQSYDNNITDEFIKPIINVDENNNSITTIKPDDVVICFNYRTDRLRQLTTVLTQENMLSEGMKTIPLQFFTMTNYNASFKGINVFYDKENIKYTIGELVSKAGRKQIRIAETEKYAHVTFFLSGGREQEFKNEKRYLISSPKVATYDLQPEMSAYLVRDKLVELINNNKAEFIVVNFANGDMVGHTGIYDAILKAVNVIDNCVKDVVEAAKNNNYSALIIADHGNSDFTINSDGSPNTAHSLNPVPCILINNEYKKISDGKLADIAPTLLKLLDIEKPIEMTGESLV